MHSYLLSMKTPPDSDAALRQKCWLPRQFAPQVIEAALEFQQLLDMQAPGELCDPDGRGDAREGVRYRNAMVMLLTAVKGNLKPAPIRPEWIKSDIVGIFALLAAEEFKYLLDVQAAKSLFYPGLRHAGRSDARQSATYERAANLLRDARFQVLQATEGLNNTSAGPVTVRCVVSDHSADASADVVNFHLDIDTALIGLGFNLVGKGNGSSENCRLFEVRLGRTGQVDEIREPIDGEHEVVHNAHPEKVNEAPFCHASDRVEAAKAALEKAKRDLVRAANEHFGAVMAAQQQGGNLAKGAR